MDEIVQVKIFVNQLASPWNLSEYFVKVKSYIFSFRFNFKPLVSILPT